MRRNFRKHGHNSQDTEFNSDSPSQKRIKHDSETQAKIDEGPTEQDDANALKTMPRSTNKQLTDIPLELIFEIFLNLEPLDLLMVSRTSRDLHNILMRRSSEYIWQNVRRQFDRFPPPPQGLNEAQHVNLIFKLHSHVRRIYPYEIFDLRCCDTCCDECIPASTIFHDDVREILQVLDLRESTSSKQILELLPGLDEETIPLLASAFERRFQEIQRSYGFSRIRVEAMFPASLKEKVASITYTTATVLWYLKHLTKLKRDHDHLCYMHQKSVEARFISLGWKTEMQYLGQEFSNHELVWQPIKLMETEKTWNEIYPKLLNLLRKERRRLRTSSMEHRLTLLECLYEDFIFEQGLTQAGYPPLGELIKSSPFHSLVWDTPMDRKLSERNFDAGFDHLPKFVQDWRESKGLELLGLMKEHIPNATTASLSLASTVFSCSRCKDYIWHPYVFNHVCFSHGPYDPPNPDPDFDPYDIIECIPWNSGSNRVAFSAEAFRILGQILDTCGLNRNTTSEDLHELDVMIECQDCRDSTKGRAFMRWQRLLILHAQDKSLSGHHAFTLVDSTTRQSVLDSESPKLFLETADLNCYFESPFLCTRCPRSVKQMEFLQLEAHLESQHGVLPSQITSEDWCWAPDTPLDAKTPPVAWLHLDE